MNDQAFDLNRLIPANSGWSLTSAVRVNNNGEIVGSGLYNGRRATFLLAPTGEPLGPATTGTTLPARPVPVAPQSIDLAVTGGSSSTAGRPVLRGTKAKLTAVISNDVASAAPVRRAPVNFYLSSDAAYDSQDRYVGRTIIRSLKSGRQKSVAVKFVTPDLPFGNYHVLAVVSSDGIDPDTSDDLMDVASFEIQRAYSELHAVSLSYPLTMHQNKPRLTVSFTLRNEGTIAANINSFDLVGSDDAMLDMDDMDDFKQYFRGSIKAGQTKTFKIRFWVQNFVGTHYLFVVPNDLDWKLTLPTIDPSIGADLQPITVI